MSKIALPLLVGLSAESLHRRLHVDGGSPSRPAAHPMKPTILAKPPWAIDPFYMADRVHPDPTGLSLFTDPGDGPCWLYAPGELDRWLFNRVRHEAFYACLNVYHPGRFYSVNPVLYASRQWTLETLPAICRVRIAACGHLHVIFNGVTVLHRSAAPVPEMVEVDLRPHLVVGVNGFTVRVHSLGEPPTLLVDGDMLRTDATWAVCTDDQQPEAPQTLPFVGADRFPHQERLPEVTLAPVSANDGLWDFGVEAYGRPEAWVRGEGTLRFYPGESEQEARNADPVLREQHVPELKPDVGRVVSPVELAFRYLRAVVSPGLTVEKVRLRASTYPVRYRGAFESSDPMLNRIWHHAAYTLRLCMREVFLDGIKRDRLPWVGDLYLAGLANACVFFDAGIMRRTLVALYGAEPEAVDFNGIVDYSFFWILALHDYVLHFGDLAFLGRMRSRLERLLRVLEAKRDVEGLIPTDHCRWLFIDWAEVDKAGYSSCLEFLSIQALDATVRMFRWLGDAEAATQWRVKMDSRRAAARVRFWLEDAGAFGDCTGGNRAGRQANALAVLAGVATPAQSGSLTERVLCNPAVPAVGTPYMRCLEAMALARCGRRDVMANGLRAYWGGMLEAGASSFWERYDATASGEAHHAMYGRPYGASLCHAWSAGPVALLSRDLFGCHPLEPGWARFSLDPRVLALERVTAVIPTPRGAITIEQCGDEVSTQIPAGTVMVCGREEIAGPSIWRKDGLNYAAIGRP